VNKAALKPAAAAPSQNSPPCADVSSWILRDRFSILRGGVGAHHDPEAARRVEGERPSAALLARRFDVKAVFYQALVDLVDLRVRRQDEADVERLGIAHRIAASGAH
jgi:hypothetical protein